MGNTSNDQRSGDKLMQTIQMVVVSGDGFVRHSIPYVLGNDEPVYGGPLEERPDDKSDHGLLERLGFHGFTCIEYLRDTFHRPDEDPGTSGIEKRLVVIHYLHLRE